MTQHPKSADAPSGAAAAATMPLAFTVELPFPHNVAIDLVTARLQEGGFGIITRIDAHRTFEEKLGIQFRPYSILGACNPRLAHQVLSHEPEAGLMLPCNVVVEETAPGRSTVRIADPQAMLGVGEFAHDPQLAGYASEARAALKAVGTALESTGQRSGGSP